MSDTTDRAVQALIDEYLGHYRELDHADINHIVATVLRVVRDDIVMAWDAGEIRDVLGVERALNQRITAVSGRPTITGDTT